MTDQVPEPLETQLRKAGEARHLFSQESFLSVTLGSLLLDVILVAGGWVAGSPSRIALTLFGIDALFLGVWIIGIPLRRWLACSPY
jgi:hypothetical protein